MSVIEALMVLYAREVVTMDRVAAAAQRFGGTAPQIQHHEDGILAWINAACAALNRAEVRLKCIIKKNITMLLKQSGKKKISHLSSCTYR